MKTTPQRYKSIILSDVHLGTPTSKAREALHFLKNTRCDHLILNGDIIDGWALERGSKWTWEHSRFVRYVLKRVEKKNLEVTYLRGNHDDFLRKFSPLKFASMSIVREYVHETERGNYLVVHGDLFDSITKNFVFLAHLGDIGYRLLMSLNRWYNVYRKWRGKEYYSLSKAIKARVKQAVSFISDFESKLAKLAETRGCVGVICGHIHTPADKRIDGFHYLNSGDWVESLSAIVEDYDGNFSLLYFSDFERLYPMDKRSDEDSVAISLERA